MEMEGSYLQKKLSRNVPPTNTLNLKMKIPLYLQSPDKFWAGRWRRRNNPTHFVTGVVFCSSKKVATTVILSRDRAPGANVVTGISRKLRGSSAEDPRKLQDVFGSAWPHFLYRTTNSQVTAFGLS